MAEPQPCRRAKRGMPTVFALARHDGGHVAMRSPPSPTLRILVMARARSDDAHCSASQP
jgi:hypothetical protein